MPERTTEKEERFILIHGFIGFSPWLLGSKHLSRTSWQWRGVMEEGLTLWHIGSRTGQGPKQDMPFRDTVTYFLQLGPTSQSFHRFPK
jgi:hypothetical protein